MDKEVKVNIDEYIGVGYNNAVEEGIREMDGEIEENCRHEVYIFKNTYLNKDTIDLSIVMVFKDVVTLRLNCMHWGMIEILSLGWIIKSKLRSFVTMITITGSYLLENFLKIWFLWFTRVIMRSFTHVEGIIWWKIRLVVHL